MAAKTSVHAGRLAALREELRRRGLSGWYLPRTDAHGSEYLPPHEERVRWLTGFSGSFAVVVVLEERAAVFTDGRYALQVREEVDPELFETHLVHETPPAKWLAGAMPEGGVLGFDPFLLTRGEAERLAKALRRRRAGVRPSEPDPVVLLWTDRPPAPRGPVTWLDERHAGESSLERRRRIGAKVAEAGAEWSLHTRADGLCWLLNARGEDIPYNPLVLGFGLLHRSGRLRWFVAEPRTGLREGLPPEVEVEPYETIGPALDELGRQGAAVLADPAQVHLAFLGRLERSGALVVEESDPVTCAKAVKNPVEIEGARRAAVRDGLAVVRFLHWLESIPRDGSLTERDVARRIDEERAKDPLFRGPSFPTIAGFGPNGAIVHYAVRPETARPIAGDGLLLVDSGGQYLDATTDITRTVALGTPTDEQRERFTRVLEGHIRLATLRFPRGTTGTQIDALARLPLWEAGLDYEHGTGHGVGSFLCVHESPPRVSKRGGDASLEPGMILSDEPGYYREGAYGIRIENLLLVVEAGRPEGGERDLLGFETLTLAPIDRRLVVPELLSPPARAWLDAYHRRVFETLAPHLEGPVRRWLEAACAPLGS